MPRILARLRRFDWGLFLATALLLAFGLAAIGSLSFNKANASYVTFLRQLSFAGIGLIGLLVLSVIHYRFFRSTAWLWYLLGLVLLVGVLTFGTEIRGTRGWFSFFNQTFQPVELVKFFLILALGKFFAERFDSQRPWRSVALSGLVVAPVVALVFLEPDLGSVLVLVSIWVGMLVLARLPGRVILVCLAIAVLLAVTAWFTILKDFQRERILTFFDPGRDPLGVGYNLRQARVAVGAGQLFGRGLGLGTQSQLDFLPVQETDFLFAVIAEELGFVGSMIVFALYGFFFYRLFRILRSTNDDFAAFTIGGVVSLLLFQTVVNIGMNIGLLPVVGLPLPLLSYGGSSLIATLLMIGVVENIAIRAKHERVGAAWEAGAGR